MLQEEAKRKAFYESMGDDEKAEFINGEVLYHSPAKYKHTLAVGNLNYILTRYVRKNKAGLITGESR